MVALINDHNLEPARPRPPKQQDTSSVTSDRQQGGTREAAGKLVLFIAAAGATQAIGLLGADSWFVLAVSLLLGLTLWLTAPRGPFAKHPQGPTRLQQIAAGGLLLTFVGLTVWAGSAASPLIAATATAAMAIAAMAALWPLLRFLRAFELATGVGFVVSGIGGALVVLQLLSHGFQRGLPLFSGPTLLGTLLMVLPLGSSLLGASLLARSARLLQSALVVMGASSIGMGIFNGLRGDVLEGGLQAVLGLGALLLASLKERPMKWGLIVAISSVLTGGVVTLAHSPDLAAIGTVVLAIAGLLLAFAFHHRSHTLTDISFVLIGFVLAAGGVVYVSDPRLTVPATGLVLTGIGVLGTGLWAPGTRHIPQFLSWLNQRTQSDSDSPDTD